MDIKFPLHVFACDTIWAPWPVRIDQIDKGKLFALVTSNDIVSCQVSRARHGNISFEVATRPSLAFRGTWWYRISWDLANENFSCANIRNLVQCLAPSKDEIRVNLWRLLLWIEIGAICICWYLKKRKSFLEWQEVKVVVSFLKDALCIAY